MNMNSNPARKPFYLFKTLEEELAATNKFWRSRTPSERMQYLHHIRTIEYGEEAMNAPMVRCYGWRKRIEDEPDPKNIVYF